METEASISERTWALSKNTYGVFDQAFFNLPLLEINTVGNFIFLA